MKKIPTIFLRGPRFKIVSEEVNPVCQWVFAGEGIATRKYDGSCCMIRDGALYKRRELKPHAVAPPAFEPADVRDPATGKQPGWVPVGDGPDDRYFREAFEALETIADGTYELIGPKINGNPEHADFHMLVPHGYTKLPDFPRTRKEMVETLWYCDFEGVVWWHPDGRKAKIKRRDFGMTRNDLF